MELVGGFAISADSPTAFIDRFQSPNPLGIEPTQNAVFKMACLPKLLPSSLRHWIEKV